MQNAMLLYSFFVSDMVPRVSHSNRAKSAGEIVIVDRNIKALQIHCYFKRVDVNLIKISIKMKIISRLSPVVRFQRSFDNQT